MSHYIMTIAKVLCKSFITKVVTALPKFLYTYDIKGYFILSKVGLKIVDDAYDYGPELEHDAFWKQSSPDLYYTPESASRPQHPALGSCNDEYSEYFENFNKIILIN